MDLFEYFAKENKDVRAPIAYRMRPESLDDFIGQKAVVGENGILYKLIKNDHLTSLILFGPSGTGKSSLAYVIAKTTKGLFISLNATVASKKDLEDAIEAAHNNLAQGIRTILFLDEIHRFNKLQQDYLLPFVEDGTIILIGATTENPFFEVNKALLSRTMVVELKPLSENDIIDVLKKAIKKNIINISGKFSITDEAISIIAKMVEGDARYALNILEISAISLMDNNGNVNIDINSLEFILNKRLQKYSSDEHYDNISAMIKSIRGSDADAGLYYLARLIEAGEDVKFIARRLMILASEDVGNADPNAISVATSASIAVERVGMPEGRIILAQAVCYLATAPKSNAAYIGINKALSLVKKVGYEVPDYLRDAHYKGAKELNRGIGYLYPHDYNDGYVNQRYLPSEIANERFYEPKMIGYEENIIKYMKKIGRFNE